MAAAVQIHQDINKQAARLNRHVEGWRKYSDIWKSDRAQVLDKFKAKAPTIAAFEERFARFQKVGYDATAAYNLLPAWQATDAFICWCGAVQSLSSYALYDLP
jgi:hypothetical protein